MINFEQMIQAIPEEELNKIQQALLDGADTLQLKELLAGFGIDLNEQDISEAASYFIKRIANDPDASIPLSDANLESVAGGDLATWRGTCCQK